MGKAREVVVEPFAESLDVEVPKTRATKHNFAVLARKTFLLDYLKILQ